MTMAEYLDYQFHASAATVEGVRAELAKFQATLDHFKDAYFELARRWGGRASETAHKRAGDIDTLGRDTAAIVNSFANEYDDHLNQARLTENRIADSLA